METIEDRPAEKPLLRQRRRAELLSMIKDVAGQHVAEAGAAALSLRGVAREVGIAVSALYRYYPSRDDLITELIVDAFDDQADTVEAAVRAAWTSNRHDHAAALRAGFSAYRQWGKEHQAQFGLCYGTPVPGYAAPPDRTVIAATRVSGILISVFAAACAEGIVDPAIQARRRTSLSPATAQQLVALDERRGYGLEPHLLALAVDAFIRIHGFCVMEVFGQLRPITPDGDPLFLETLADVMHDVGLPPSRLGPA